MKRGIDQRGQAAVELALVLPLVVGILLALLQVGLVMRDQVLVVHAAREAARAAAVDPNPAAAYRAAKESSGGLIGDRLVVTTTGRAGAGSRVTAMVRYRAPTVVPLGGAALGDFRLEGTATMRVEQ